MVIFKKDITDAAGSPQYSTGHEAGTVTAIHKMRDIFANEDTEVVLLIDPEIFPYIPLHQSKCNAL